MLDEKDLQAISELMDEKITAPEARTDEKFAALEARMLAGMDEKITASEARTDEKFAALEARTDEKFAALEARMDEKIAATEARMEKLILESEARTMAHVDEKVDAAEARMLVMMESFFTPKFNLLADSIALLHEKLAPKEAVEVLEDRVDVLEAAVKHHSQEITELKKAQ